ncbi:MAG: hypothetical protein JO115_19985 [Pseudonocardiales bacterium]|nr:hypothetical protein [Pseudonocardiales bacterium]
MSRRPTDWSPLALSSDPVPGDPDEIERAARSLADVAEEITRQAANLRKLSTAEGWDADVNRPPAYPPTPEEAGAERHRQYAYDEGLSALRAAHRKLDEATQHRDEHAGRAASAIR